MKILVLATRNKGKIKEYKVALEPLGFTCVSLDDLKFHGDIVENGKTFVKNAKIKAKIVGNAFRHLTLADDSGLIVDALPKELGVKSKRFSKEATTNANNKLLLEKLNGVKNRKAHFECALVLYNPTKGLYTFKGRVDGIIMDDLKGDNGFGYDPLFYIPQLDKRMAELTNEQKNEISHRGLAIKKLVKAIEENNEIIDF